MGELTLQEWFKQSDTPLENSPIGKLIVRILEESPELSFEEARRQANECQQMAARGKRYVLRTPKQIEAGRQRARNAFKTP
jgi:hypothetical protein